MKGYKCYHWSRRPVVLNRGLTYPQDEFKPHGLWFDVDGDWQRFCEGKAIFRHDFNHKYEVTVDWKGIKKITTIEGLLGLAKRFNSGPMRKLGISGWIDWRKVAKCYRGVVIPRWLGNVSVVRRPEVIWYYGWDCASGCVWDLSAVVDFREVEHVSDERGASEEAGRKAVGP